MIKKEIAIIAGVAAVIVILIVAFFVPSCEPEPDRPRSKYVVFSSEGHEKYHVNGGGTETVELEYDIMEEYKFGYEVFYSDDDSFTGESSREYVYLKANKPGTYELFAYFQYDNRREHSILKVIIKEKQMLTPEVRFDPNGATVEERDGETIYVYDYDGKDHFPLIELYYEGEQLELDLYSHGLVSIKRNGEYYRYFEPWEIGIYTVEYWVYDDDYVNAEDLNRFRGVKATITVEIR